MLGVGALTPLALVDAIIAKRNLGTNIDMAQIVVALGRDSRPAWTPTPW